MDETATELDAAVRAVCPAIYGVSVGSISDKTTWIIWFEPSATADQQTAAESALQNFTAS